MTLPTFAAQKKAWSSPPVDDIGYIPAKDLLAMSDDTFAETMTNAINNRYLGWRNPNDNWRRVLRMHETTGKRILDYGTGIGIEAYQYTGENNRVWVADIAPDNLRVARRLFELSGEKLEGAFNLSEKPPFSTWFRADQFDVIHCAGVLHHIPNAREVVEQMHGWLAPGGELRLMLYSETAWVRATGLRPSRTVAAEDDPRFVRFVSYWDAVGGYADWYDKKKLRSWFGEWFDVASYGPLTAGGEYVGAVLVKK